MKVDLDEDFDSRPLHLDHRHEGEMVEFERLLIKQRNQKIGQHDGKYVGLALSGGGIRSASFSLGIMQALARFGSFKHIDYLSTVSGGGYIGSSLTWFLNKKWEYGKDKKSEFGVDAENFPFGTTPNTHSETPGAGSQEKMSILRHLRQNLNYLFPGNGINPAAFFAALLRGIVFNVLVYVPILVVLLIGLAWLGGFGDYLEMRKLRHLAKLSGVLFSFALLAGVS